MKCNFRFAKTFDAKVYCMLKYKQKYNESPECDEEECVIMKILQKG